MDTKTRKRILDWRSDIVREAKTWRGTPFHHKGRIKGTGVDCGGFIYEVFKTVTGLPHEPYPDYYAEDWGLHMDNNEIYLSFLQPYVIPTRRLELGDVIMFKMGRSFCHGTLYIGNKSVIHAYGCTGHGSVIVSPLSMFNIGSKRDPRERKMFTLDESWLK